jgi:predicted N-formylglutamate amidohydrolase
VGRGTGLARDQGELEQAATVAVENAGGSGAFVLVCEHASSTIPEEYGDLGLSNEARESHIAWDPGALPLSRALASLLDAPLVVQLVSRLVYDCNRPPESPGAIATTSEVYGVPGNEGLSPAERRRRAERYYEPFRATLSGLLADRRSEGRSSVLVTVHTFTPVFHGTKRDVEIGLLHDADARLVDAMLEGARRPPDRELRRNEPYGPQDGVTHTLKVHALPAGIANVMLEIRNDLVADDAGVKTIAAMLAPWLEEAAHALARAGVREAG